jgi:hypothetical protein
MLTLGWDDRVALSTGSVLGLGNWIGKGLEREGIPARCLLLEPVVEEMVWSAYSDP